MKLKGKIYQMEIFKIKIIVRIIIINNNIKMFCNKLKISRFLKIFKLMKKI